LFAPDQRKKTMNVRGLFAALREVLFCGGFALATCSAGCMVAPEGDDEETAHGEAVQPEPEVEEPLDLTVGTLDIVHGSLRVIATMTDGAADVSVRLGGDCEAREVGGGISTPSTLVWAFGENDLADALSCGLVVRARAREGNGFVSKVATLDVAAAATAAGETAGETADESAPALQAVTTAEEGIHLVFAPLARSARLTTGDSVLEADRSDPSDPDSAEDGAGDFTVPRIDFARSVLRSRPFYVDGTPFATSLSMGGTPLDGSSVASDGTDGAEVVEEETPAPTDEPIAQD
jgi:hypothetical protein